LFLGKTGCILGAKYALYAALCGVVDNILKKIIMAETLKIVDFIVEPTGGLEPPTC
jgi:hypothetical protein